MAIISKENGIIKGTGDPNDNVTISEGYLNMPVNYYDTSSENTTDYN